MARVSRKTEFDVYLGNLPSTADEKSIRELFRDFDIIGVYLKESLKSGKKFKLAFVHFRSAQDAEQAIRDKHGFSWNGCSLFVRKSDQWLTRIKESNLKNGHPDMQRSINSGKASAGTDLFKTQELCFYVIHIIDPVSFYAQIQEDCEKLLELQNELQKICEHLEAFCNNSFSENQIYAAKFSEDDSWYRCRIMQRDCFLKKSKIHYVDFGNQEMISNDLIVELPTRISSMPPFAYKSKFQHLQSISEDNPLFEDAVEFVSKLLKNCLMTATVLVQENSKDKLLTIVSLEHEGLNVIDYLLSHKYAISPYDTVTPTQPKQTVDHLKRKMPFKLEGSSLNNQNGKPRYPESAACSRVLAKPTYRSNTVFVPAGAEKSSLGLVEDINHQLSQERGKCTSMEKEIDRLSKMLCQKPDILERCDMYSPEVALVEDIAKVKVIRQQLPCAAATSLAKDYIELSIHLIFHPKDEPLPEVDDEIFKAVEEKDEAYKMAQKAILDCRNAEELQPLITERNTIQSELLKCLWKCSETFLGQEFKERRETIEAVLIAIQNIYSHFLEIRTNDSSSLPLKQLVSYYREMKRERFHFVQPFQSTTDTAHATFFAARQSLTQALSFETFENGCAGQSSFSEQNHKSYIHAIHNLHKALSQEIENCNLEGSKDAAVIGILTQKLFKALTTEVNKLEHLCQSESLYRGRLDVLMSSENTSSDLSHIHELRRCIKRIKSKIRHALAEKLDLEESDENDEAAIVANQELLSSLRVQLHTKLAEDSNAMDKASLLFATVYPEMDLLYPELAIAEYLNSGCLVKQLHQIEYYNIVKNPNAVGDEAFTSIFVRTPIILKEVSTLYAQKDRFLEKAIKYNRLKHKNLIAIDAIFFSQNSKFAYVQEKQYETLASKCKPGALTVEEVIDVLWGILNGLKALHDVYLVHGALHPESIFVPDNFRGLQLDVIRLTEDNFQNQKFPILNGLNFKCPTVGPSDPAADMFSFFCIALWSIYSETQFTVNDEGIPDLRELVVDKEKLPVYQLITSAFMLPISKYPSADEVLQSPLFASRRTPEDETKRVLPNIPVEFQFDDSDIEIDLNELVNKSCDQILPADNQEVITGDMESETGLETAETGKQTVETSKMLVERSNELVKNAFVDGESLKSAELNAIDSFEEESSIEIDLELQKSMDQDDAKVDAEAIDAKSPKPEFLDICNGDIKTTVLSESTQSIEVVTGSTLAPESPKALPLKTVESNQKDEIEGFNLSEISAKAQDINSKSNPPSPDVESQACADTDTSTAEERFSRSLEVD